MRPDHLLLVWAATYAAEYVRLSAVPLSGLIQSVASEAAKTADDAVEDLRSLNLTPNIEGYEKL